MEANKKVGEQAPRDVRKVGERTYNLTRGKHVEKGIWCVYH